MILLKLNNNVDITVRTEIIPEDGAEKSQCANMIPRQNPAGSSFGISIQLKY